MKVGYKLHTITSDSTSGIKFGVVAGCRVVDIPGFVVIIVPL